MNKKSDNKKHIVDLFIGIILTLGVYFGILFVTRRAVSTDTTTFQTVWWHYLFEHGWSGIATLNTTHFQYSGNYTTIWYFFIVCLTKVGIYPHFSLAFCIKAIALFGSVISSVTMFFIVKHFRPDSTYIPTISALITLFLPAFLGDIIKTNLPDSIYLMFCLLSYLAFLKNKFWSVAFLIGLAASFKLMAIYLAPVYLYFYIRDFKKYKVTQKFSPLATVIAIVLSSLPNVFAGGTFLGGIIQPLLGRSSASMKWLSNSIWVFLPVNADKFKGLSFVLTGGVLFVTGMLVHHLVGRTREKQLLTFLPILSTLICTYILPAQHGNYFALATVFSLLAFVVFPNKYYFILFIFLNILLLTVYAGPVVPLFNKLWTPRLISIIFLVIIIYCYGLLFYKKHPSNTYWGENK